jgi:sugar lactone lactonase YvrE
MAIDAAGNVYVVDRTNNTIRRITPAGVVTTLAGKAGVTGNADGTGSAASFDNPTDVAIDSTGNLYVPDALNSTIRRITPGGAVTTVAGTPGSRGVHLGSLPGSLNQPRALAVLPGPGVTLVEVDTENAVLQIKLQ